MQQAGNPADEEVGRCNICVREKGSGDFFMHEVYPEHLAIYVHFDDDDFDGDGLYVRRVPDKDPDIFIKSQYKNDSAATGHLIDKLLPYYKNADMGDYLVSR
jgi:hypothetical protein